MLHKKIISMLILHNKAFSVSDNNYNNYTLQAGSRYTNIYCQRNLVHFWDHCATGCHGTWQSAPHFTWLNFPRKNWAVVASDKVVNSARWDSNDSEWVSSTTCSCVRSLTSWRIWSEWPAFIVSRSRLINSSCALVRCTSSVWSSSRSWNWVTWSLSAITCAQCETHPLTPQSDPAAAHETESNDHSAPSPVHSVKHTHSLLSLIQQPLLKLSQMITPLRHLQTMPSCCDKAFAGLRVNFSQSNTTQSCHSSSRFIANAYSVTSMSRAGLILLANWQNPTYNLHKEILLQQIPCVCFVDLEDNKLAPENWVNDKNQSLLCYDTVVWTGGWHICLINLVALCRAWLVLGWVTVWRQVNYITNRPGQLSLITRRVR